MDKKDELKKDELKMLYTLLENATTPVKTAHIAIELLAKLKKMIG